MLQKIRNPIKPPKKIISIVTASLVVFAAFVTIGVRLSTLGWPPNNADLTQYVNPFIGTDATPTNRQLGNGFNSGNVFPGASYPHGMVQWSPDTTSAPGGYRYAQSIIHGFSLTHFSGRGCSAYQDFPFLPIPGPVIVSPAVSSAYAASFSHSNEEASPGYYNVLLSSGIDVALTVTLRSGFGRFIYPPSQAAAMLINAGGSATGNSDHTGIQVLGPDQVVGWASSGHFCGNNTYTIYFAAIFDHSFTTFGTWNGAQVEDQNTESTGPQSGAYLQFDTRQNQIVQAKVGISFVSIANAQANVAAENPGWNFDAIRSKAHTAWNVRLHSIEVTGGTLDERTIFYTALYHCFFHPNVFSDVNGEYIGFDQQVHQAKGYIQYENFPGWDMYRSLIGLLAILYPQEVSDMMQSLVADARQGGGGLPRWEVANDNSGGMVGDSQDAVIATAYAFGARNFNLEEAWDAMNLGASHPEVLSGRNQVRQGLSDYLTLGYVSTSTSQSAAFTLEYAIDDFAIAQFAQALGRTHDAGRYLLRAGNWRNLFNEATGLIEPRNADGTFIPNFNVTSSDQFAEGDSVQYSWLVPQDLGGLFQEMGGTAQVIARLDAHFQELNAGPNSLYAFMGNEPEFGVPWEYDAAGVPYRTQEVVRRMQTQLFAAAPAGLPGNDDGGAISSWYVFAALGFYPEVPGVAGFLLNSPLFPAITVHLGNGHTLQITGQSGSPVLDQMPYVQGLWLNGQSYTTPWLPFTALMHGASLQFALGVMPNTAWGSRINFTFTPPPAPST